MISKSRFQIRSRRSYRCCCGVDYNQKLSERRAASVVRYLANKGVDTTKLSSVGKDKSDLKWPECNPVTNCPAWKNLENRHVIFKEIK
ncbi:OmpA family protein [Empedobacter sp. UBA2044]|uniref:OmpA family protein n=1 Tax=Empedobacter sp. UBA2044 TaxID=1946432 RepID=UPI0039C87F05